MDLGQLIERYGCPYSEALGIDLRSGKNGEVVKWFLASLLYAKPIRESSATKTYRCFEAHGVLTVRKILDTGWEGLVSILDEGGYTRYDFSTADKLLRVFGELQRRYGGNLNTLHEKSRNGAELESRLRGLGKGIGESSVSIFLRELRGIWGKADPKPTPTTRLAMEALGISDLKSYASMHNIDVVRLETALFRLGRDFAKKRLWPSSSPPRRP